MKPIPTPPRFVVRAVLRLHAALLRAAEGVIPGEFAVFEHIGGFWKTQLVYVAARLRFADHLEEGPLTAEELARRAGADADAVRRTMRALVAIGVFAYEDGRFKNNRVSLPLRSNVPGSMRDVAQYFGARSNMHAWADFETTVKTGENAFERVHGCTMWQHHQRFPEEGKTFAASMASVTALDAPGIAGAYPFHGSICDVGGGRGTLLAEILARTPRTRGVLFDEAHVLEQAGPILAERGVADRVDRIAGSFFDQVPSGCDIYMLKDILHDWDDARALSILRTVRRAMRTGAKLLVLEVLLEPDELDAPASLLDVHMMTATCNGRQRSERELGALFAASGLSLAGTHVTPMPVSVVEAVAT
jgi:hypothetical protein